MKEQALRFNDGKIRHDLIPAWAMEEVAKVFTYGADKHSVSDEAGNVITSGARNWEKGAPWTVSLASLERHLNAFKDGKDFDDGPKGSGLYHLAHLITNALFLLQYYRIFSQGDDRPHNYLKARRIGLDIDGTIAEFSKAYAQRLTNEGVENYPQEQQPWWGFPPGADEVWDKTKQDDSFWMNLKPLFNPEELPFEPVCYISKRTIPVKWSEQWIVRNGFPFAPVVHVEHSKVEAYKEYNLDVLADDSLKNFIELNREGLNCALVDQSYNRYIDVGHKRIQHLAELINK